MAYCPNCHENVQIVVTNNSSSNEVYTKTDKYVEDEYGIKTKIGYDESYQPVTEVYSTPRCSNCFSVIKFPEITSASAYYDKEAEIRKKAEEIELESLKRQLNTLDENTAKPPQDNVIKENIGCLIIGIPPHSMGIIL